MNDELLILIKIDDYSEWEEWLISGLYVLNEKENTAKHMGGEKIKLLKQVRMPKTIESKKLFKKVMKEGEGCLHEHLSCPGDITTIKCAVCGKSMYDKD